MNRHDHELIQEMKMKMNQHEETITQLLTIVAATNKRLTHLAEGHDTHA